MKPENQPESAGRAGRGTVGNVDWPVAVRGASAGFSVLLIGGLLGPLAAVKVPAAGGVLLTATAIGAFFLAARKTGNAASPPVHGAVAAVLAYALVLPLVLQSAIGRDLRQIAMTTATAISVGALTGWIMARTRA
ncbi:MAG: hypothetical protein ACJ71Z_05665 [Aeromicrobium sp.]